MRPRRTAPSTRARSVRSGERAAARSRPAWSRTRPRRPRSARSLSRHVLPPLGRAAPIGPHASLARPAALHRRGHALIAAVQAAAPRGQKTAFTLPVVGKPVTSIVCNHRAPRRGQIVGLIYATGSGLARRVAGAEVRRARASPAAARAGAHASWTARPRLGRSAARKLPLTALLSRADTNDSSIS
jgi:hypothetical protein